ncbi:hypothetical protein AB6A23_13960 [Paenibacillus tarimensis]
MQASSLVPYSIKWLEMIGSFLPIFTEEIDAGDYTKPASTVSMRLSHTTLRSVRKQTLTLLGTLPCMIF